MINSLTHPAIHLRLLFSHATASSNHHRHGRLSVKPPPDSRNGIFFTTVFFPVVYYLVLRWREKVRMVEMAAVIAFVGCFVFFRSSLVHHSHFSDEEEEDLKERTNCVSVGCKSNEIDDEAVIREVASGKTPSYLLESKLGDCKRAVFIRRAAVEMITGRSLDGLPIEGFDYESILGQCCEMPIGYVQIPVGIAGPLLLDGEEFSVPMATTEGCLVASTNRGCKAIYAAGGATSVLLRDGMTRAPIVRFATAKRAAELKFFLEEPFNFETLASVFNK